MRATATFVMLTAVIGLAGCGNTGAPVARPGNTNTISTTAADATTAPTNTASSEITPEVEIPTEEPSPPLELSCGVDEDTFTSLTAAWSTDDSLADMWDCTATINPDTYVFKGTEAAAALAYEKSDDYYGEDGKIGALEDILGLCASREIDVDGLLGVDRKTIPYALRICPKAPHAPLMRIVLAKEVFIEGDLVVGEEVKAGTYHTEKGIRNCYWERTSKGGGTIANDFVTFAAKGVTVTIRSSDGGFSSTGCRTWTKVP